MFSSLARRAGLRLLFNGHQKLTKYLITALIIMSPHILCKISKFLNQNFIKIARFILSAPNFKEPVDYLVDWLTNSELLLNNRACLRPNMDCTYSPPYTDELHGIQQYWHCLYPNWLFTNGQSRRVELRTFQNNSSLKWEREFETAVGECGNSK